MRSAGYDGTTQSWMIKSTGPIGLPKSRRSIPEVRLPGSFQIAPKIAANMVRKDRNPKAFSFANPGRLAKTAARSHDVGYTRCRAGKDTNHGLRSRKNGSMYLKWIGSPKNLLRVLSRSSVPRALGRPPSSNLLSNDMRRRTSPTRRDPSPW